MDTPRLNGKRIAILATDGFQMEELLLPKKALEQAGAKTFLVSLEKGKIKGWKNGNWAESLDVDLTVEQAHLEDFDALLLPGGALNPDKLRLSKEAVEFIRKFDTSTKPIAAICHAPSLLIEAGIVRDRQLTSWLSIKTDLINAGARWVNAEVVNDKGLVTSRKPSDIPAFNQKMIEEFSETRHTPFEQITTDRLATRH